MKVQDLRIGNIVKNPSWNKEINYIVLDDFELWNRFPEIFENIEPIEITEEWLLKFGFEEHSVYQKVFYKPSTLPDKNLFWFSMIIGSNVILRDMREFHEMAILNEVLYVHQLQNLYFALTGEELTLKQ